MRSKPGVVWSVGPLFLAAALSLPTAPPAHGQAPLIVPSNLPAAGRATALLTVAQPGRYAITATSRSGTALQVVDRLAGPGEVSGAAGERDGRVDLLLDRGSYLLVTQGAPEALGEIALEARPFREQDAAQPALLVEEKPVAGELLDLQQRSWWLKVDARRRVILEAAGRNLADLRLFRDGGWLVDAEPVRETIEPDPGRPLRSCRIVASLEPGLYLLSAFGGPDEPWPAGGDQHPLHLRFGIPSLADAGRTRYRVGPFGADHFIVPGTVTFAQLELPEATDARLTEAPFPADGDPFGTPDAEMTITKQSREPVAALELPATGQPRLVTVRAAAGQPYVLQHFEERDSYAFHRSGRYWIGSVHSGHPQDSADATAIVIGTATAARRGVEPLLSQTVEIGAARGWARRCNLLDTLTVFFRVRERGSYEVLLRGDAAARARFEPFLVTRPRDYREPDLKPSGSTWNLEAGWHVLTVVPDKPGIVEAAVRPAGKLDAIWDLLDPGRPMRGEPVLPGVTFPAVDLLWDDGNTVYLNRRPGIRSGLVLRTVPVDLTQPLPLALLPGQEITVQARVDEAGTIRAEAESGGFLEVRVGSGPWLDAVEAQPVTLQVQVRNQGAASVTAALRFEALRLSGSTPLPLLPPAALQPPPQFPEITEEAPRFLDLERGGEATFAVQVAQPAFHTLESTGLLATAGTLRSRFIPELFGATGGGTGRNFLVGGFLREGDYQLTVKAQGESRGHLGLRLRRSPLRDGGPLREGAASRVTVAAAEGAFHDFEIVEAGSYRLGASAVGRALACRLEDADGWPLETPGGPARFERRFEPGRYRLLLLPDATGTRRVTLLERVPEPRRFEGHGPHPLDLDRAVEHTWVEPAAEAARVPDGWEFSLPAPATVIVTLSGEMQGEISSRDAAAGGAVLAKVPPGRGWTGPLPAGKYRLAAVCSRRNNHSPYEIAVRTVELLAGTSRPASASASIPVSVGAVGLYEFATSGDDDVRARLVDAAGATIAEQEDRPDDWNVQLAARLSPGYYRIELTPTAAESAETRVAMRAIAERQEPPFTLPGSRDVLPGEDVAVIPVSVPAGASLLVLRAGAEETIGLAVERAAGDDWTELWSGEGSSVALELPLPVAAAPDAAGYRLRIWSLDRRGSAVRLAAAALTPQRISERELAAGAPVAAIDGVDPPLAVAEIAMDRPGLLRLEGTGLWRASGAAHAPLRPSESALAAAPHARLWVAAEPASGARAAELRGERFELRPGASITVELPSDGTPVACDIRTEGVGPVMVTATAAAGRPAVTVARRGRSGRESLSAAATAALGGEAVSSLIDGAGPWSVLAWSADAGRPAARATVRLLEFAGADTTPLPPGRNDGLIAPSQAQRYTLPRGDKRLRVVLGRGLAAALTGGGRTESTLDAGARSVAESMDTAAEALVIVNAGDSPAPWSADILPLEARDRTAAVAPATPRIGGFAAAGTTRIAISPDAGAGMPLVLHVLGVERAATYLAADGRILTGTGIEVGSGGTLLLRHERTLAAVWVARPGEEAAGLWGGTPAPGERTIGQAGIVRLDGPATALKAGVPAPAVLQLRTDRSFVGVIRRGAEPPTGFVQPQGATFDLHLPAGTTSIWLRSPDGAELSGSAEVLLSPVTPIGEGPGPEMLLGPGAGRYFSFVVEREGPVGVGVRATPDTATCRLIDHAGRTIGEGIVQMSHLTPGTYLLAVKAPADGGPVTVRPALAGLVPPGTGPPEDVVRHYLQLRDAGEPEETE